MYFRVFCVLPDQISRSEVKNRSWMFRHCKTSGLNFEGVEAGCSSNHWVQLIEPSACNVAEEVKSQVLPGKVNLQFLVVMCSCSGINKTEVIWERETGLICLDSSHVTQIFYYTDLEWVKEIIWKPHCSIWQPPKGFEAFVHSSLHHNHFWHEDFTAICYDRQKVRLINLFKDFHGSDFNRGTHYVDNWHGFSQIVIQRCRKRPIWLKIDTKIFGLFDKFDLRSAHGELYWKMTFFTATKRHKRWFGRIKH